MSALEAAVYIHLVWATWERAPLLIRDLERGVWRGVAAACEDMKVGVVAIGGVADHIHLLVQLPSALSVAELAKRVKGSSAHLVNSELAPGTSFKWQPGYGSVSVSPRHLAQICDYIARQREHHAANNLLPLLENTVRHTDARRANRP